MLTYWLEGEDVHFRIRGVTTGWLAIGVEGPGGGMIDADIIITRVQDGQVTTLLLQGLIVNSP